MENIDAKQIQWEDLSISNDFLFGKVMQNPELCKELLLSRDPRNVKIT